MGKALGALLGAHAGYAIGVGAACLGTALVGPQLTIGAIVVYGIYKTS